MNLFPLYLAISLCLAIFLTAAYAVATYYLPWLPIRLIGVIFVVVFLGSLAGLCFARATKGIIR